MEVCKFSLELTVIGCVSEIAESRQYQLSFKSLENEMYFKNTYFNCIFIVMLTKAFASCYNTRSTTKL